jgi:phosphoribosyl-AMP cyclohydrolase
MLTPKFDDQGLIPAVVQDAETGQVLMVAWMNAESYQKTIQTGETVFWSRSRRELWHKGETSGNTQRVVEMFLDCDCDTVLVRVKPAGPACHTGRVSCFFQPVENFGTENQLEKGNQ